MRNGHLQFLFGALLVVLLGAVGHQSYAQERTGEFSLKIPPDRAQDIVKRWGLTLSDDTRYLLDKEGHIIGGRVQEFDRYEGLYVLKPVYIPKARLVIQDGNVKEILPFPCMLSKKLCPDSDSEKPVGVEKAHICKTVSNLWGLLQVETPLIPQTCLKSCSIYMDICPGFDPGGIEPPKLCKTDLTCDFAPCREDEPRCKWTG